MKYVIYVIAAIICFAVGAAIGYSMSVQFGIVGALVSLPISLIFGNKIGEIVIEITKNMEV